MVGLAKELRHKPFHLVLSHNQRGDSQVALEEAFANGLGLFPNNVSVTKFGRHPGIEGTGFVPYYALFGADGKLLDHYQGGPYHGGNGDAVFGKVRRLVAALPSFYVGEEPFMEHASLVKSLQSEAGRGPALRELGEWLGKGTATPELSRLREAANRWVGQRVSALTDELIRDPERGLERLKAVHGVVLGSPWERTTARIIELIADPVDSDYLKAQVRPAERSASKAFVEIEKRWQSLKPFPGNGGPVRNPFHDGFRREHAEALHSLRSALAKLRETYPDTLAAKDSFTMINLLEMPEEEE